MKLADFGLAKLAPAGGQRMADLTQATGILGTPHYMAPEQIERPSEVDERADLYSLGVVFYEMLTGELPLGRFPPPSQKSGVDPRLDPVVLRALEKDPRLRYQQAGEMLAAIQAFSGHPLAAAKWPSCGKLESSPPPPAWRRVCSFCSVNTLNSLRLLLLLAFRIF